MHKGLHAHPHAHAMCVCNVLFVFVLVYRRIRRYHRITDRASAGSSSSKPPKQDAAATTKQPQQPAAVVASSIRKLPHMHGEPPQVSSLVHYSHSYICVVVWAVVRYCGFGSVIQLVCGPWRGRVAQRHGGCSWLFVVVSGACGCL